MCGCSEGARFSKRRINLWANFLSLFCTLKAGTLFPVVKSFRSERPCIVASTPVIRVRRCGDAVLTFKRFRKLVEYTRRILSKRLAFFISSFRTPLYLSSLRPSFRSQRVPRSDAILRFHKSQISAMRRCFFRVRRPFYAIHVYIFSAGCGIKLNYYTGFHRVLC